MFENEKLKEKKPGIYHAMGDTAGNSCQKDIMSQENHKTSTLSQAK